MFARSAKTSNILSTPYDYNSIMHYKSLAFTRNNKPVITNLSGKKFRQKVSYAGNNIITWVYCIARSTNLSKVIQLHAT